MEVVGLYESTIPPFTTHHINKLRQSCVKSYSSSTAYKIGWEIKLFMLGIKKKKKPNEYADWENGFF